MENTTNIKKQLARVFDNDLRTKQWQNWGDYIIIGLIVISTLSIFISTFYVSPICEKILSIIDFITVITFTIEVSLRIWCADEINPKYKGFWGRIKYCCTFYGLIDIISTYSFYVAMIFPLPYTMLKSLRVLRLIRVFRYMHSFRLLQTAFASKVKEMIVSLQFLVIVTLMLSFVLYFYEHSAQPDVYNNGFKSVLWAFTQYIGDPGGFADTPPVTFTGRMIACIIGLLGIALFAVPAGLIGSGFSEAIEEEKHEKKIKQNTEKLKNAFERKLDRPTGFQIIPQHLSLCDIQARVGLKLDDIIDAVEESKKFRLVNLAVTQTIEERPQDKLAVEHFIVNRPYGCCIDRGSRITIVSSISFIEPSAGNFSYYVAMIGGFNYISRELGEMRPFRSFYKFDNANDVPGLAEYMEDLNRLTAREDAWIVSLLPASGANEPSYPTQIHFTAGGNSGNEDFVTNAPTVLDKDLFKGLFDDAAEVFASEFGLGTDFQRYHGDSLNGDKLFTNKLSYVATLNSFAIRIAWSVILWDSRRIAVAKKLAELLAKHVEGRSELTIAPDLKIKKCGY
ncbi:MAG: ion transporter [Bacteroidaceae bacterium]|nr:ion transporter [Bacteroidaceae bacterium]